MAFEIRDSVCEPGKPLGINDDRFAVAGDLAAVIDGATGLGDPLLPGGSDAAWLAGVAAEALSHAAGGDLRARIAAAAAEAEQRFLTERSRAPAAGYEMPYASLMALRFTDDGLETAAYGDCGALIRDRRGFRIAGTTFGAKAAESARAAAVAQESTRSQSGLREAALPGLRAARNLVNRPEGPYWLFAPDRACAPHARIAQDTLDGRADMLLATDGFLALAAEYGAYTPEGLLDAALSRGLAALYGELRGIEASDPQARRYPRFKLSDDATALLITAGA